MTDRRVPPTLIAWPNPTVERNAFAVDAPFPGSLIFTHDLNGKAKSLEEDAARKRPPILLEFVAFRIMMECGIVLPAIAFRLFLRSLGHRFDMGWRQYASTAGVSLGFIASLAGWSVTGLGRKPFVVYEHLRTADAVSWVASGAIAISLAVTLILYNALLLGFFLNNDRRIWSGPLDSGRIAPSSGNSLQMRGPTRVPMEIAE